MYLRLAQDLRRAVLTSTDGDDAGFQNLPDAIAHNNAHCKLGLKEAEIRDLAEYLKSL